MAAFTVPLASCADKATNRFPNLAVLALTFDTPFPSAVLDRNNVRVFDRGEQVMIA